MADDIISLVIKVDDKGVVKGVKNAKSLENNIKALSKSFKGGSLSQRQYYKGIKELAAATGRSETELRKFANELRRAERVQRAAAAAARLEAEARRAAAQAAREAAAAARETARLAREEAKLAREAANAARTRADANRRLRMEFREGYAAQVQLRAAQMRLSQAHRQGIISAEEYARQLARLGDSSQNSSRHMSRAGVAMQQVGYQTGDFLVQVQSGQSAMVAFGQQATQMVGALYMLPAATLASSVSILGLSVSVSVLIASLGIIIPLLTAIGAAYLKMKKANDKSADAVTYLDGKIKSITSSLEDYKALQEAIASGVSLDQLFATRGIDKAKNDLAAAKKELERFAEFTEAVGPAANPSAFIDQIKSLFGADKASKYEAAVKRVIAAETVLAELRQKEADTRADNFADSSLKLKQELEILQAQADFGKDSPQSINKELEQELRNRKSAIDARVVAGELDANAAASLKSQVERAAALLALVVSNTTAEERKAEAIKLSYEYSQRQADLAQEQKAAVEAIVATVDQETKSLKDQIDLNKLILQHGKESSEVKAFQAEQARNNYKAEKEAEGILGNNLKIIMASYDENVKITDEMYNLVDAATDLGTRLGMAFSDAINLIRQAKAEAMVGLDAFGGSGDFKYSTPTVFNKLKKTGGRKSGGGGGGKSPAEELSEYLQKKQEEARLQERLLGLFGEERDIQSELISAKEKYNGVMTTAQANELEATLRQIAADKERQAALEESNAQMQSIADTMQSSMSDAFMSMVEGTKSFKDSMKDMARAVIKQLFDILVVQKLVGSFDKSTGAKSGIVGSIMGAFGFANGGAFSGGSQIQAFANGGVVGGPTMFPMTGGKTGLMGEAGPEAIMPLKRGANGKLGVEASGGGGGTTISQNFYFTANGDESVKRIIQQEAPRIANLTQKQIMDQRRRGGNMKATFG